MVTLTKIVIAGSLVVALSGCKIRNTASNTAAGSESSQSHCQVEDMSGRNLTSSQITAQNDPFAKLVLSQGDCPTTLRGTSDMIRRNQDKTKCRDSLGIAAVSERSRLLNAPDFYRLILGSQCGDPIPDRFVLTSDLLIATKMPYRLGYKLADEFEVMAFEPKASDSSQGFYNFYAFEQGKWRFFGSSIDLLSGPGAGITSDGSTFDQQRRCANCHTGGGPVMKELRPPWANWSSGLNMPGLAELTKDVAKELGQTNDTPASGEFFETDVVRAGNARWNKERLNHLKQNGTVQDLLRPLFCTVEFNLEFGGKIGGTEDDSQLGTTGIIGQIPRLALYDELGFHFTGPIGWAEPELGIDQKDLLKKPWFGQGQPATDAGIWIYRKVLQEVGQRMEDDSGRPLINQVARVEIKGPNGTTVFDPVGSQLTDTFANFAYPSRSGADVDYTNLLSKQKVINSKLAYAALNADFTMPVFSEPRCKLLEFAPTLKPEERTAGNIVNGFVANLKAKASRSPIEEQFLADLERTERVSLTPQYNFLRACEAYAKSDQHGFVRDIVKITSQRRKMALGFSPVIEHNEVLPVDNLNIPKTARLDPVTCKFVN